MSHTPGPWEFDPIDRVVVKGSAEIAYMGWSANKADARLIAAAPELLETLEELYRLIDDAHDGDRVFTFELAQKAKAAIAKARGQE
jgi:hypothetical protein